MAWRPTRRFRTRRKILISTQRGAKTTEDGATTCLDTLQNGAARRTSDAGTRALDAALAGPTTYSPAADAPRPHHDTPSRAARPSLVWSPVVSAGRPSGPFVATTQSTRHRLYDRVCSMA